MYELFETLSDYYSRSDFRIFQNNLSQDIYETLATSYSNSDGEVKTVTDMCNAINGKHFEKFHYFSKKIHGSRSYVEFNNKDKPTTKELADMVLMSIATKDNEIIYEKTAFIQNKKEETSENWKIEQDQLYLLQNFPTFKGKKGIFKNNYSNEICFLNHSKALGNYGLFQNPGEMILTNAETIYRLQKNGKISLSDIKKYYNDFSTSSNCSPFHSIEAMTHLLDPMALDKIIHHIYKNYQKFGFPCSNLPFLNNKYTSFNIHEIIRNWSLFNIGELVRAKGYIFDENLSKLNQILLKSVGFSNITRKDNDYPEFESNITIFITHLNLNDN